MALITPSIPVSEIVAVTPSTIEPGSVGLVFNGLIATRDERVPVGTVQLFTNAKGVSDYFGPTHKLTALATIYFLGFDDSTVKPKRLLISRWPGASVAAWIRGGDIASAGLDAIKAVNATLSINVDGIASSATINLSAATSFSNAATIIGNLLSETVTYDSVSKGFVITSGTTGASSTIAYATGAAAPLLKLTAATGAVTSQGSAAQVAAEFLDGVIGLSQGWVSFTTDWEGTLTEKTGIAAWFNGQGRRYLPVIYDSDATSLGSSTPSPAFQAIFDAEYDGIYPLYTDPAIDTLGGQLAAFTMGAIASIDLQRLNGRHTFAFRRQSGQPAHIKNATAARNLEDWGINFYGSWSEADDQFIFNYPGRVTGPFMWLDSYLNQLWIASRLRTTMMNLLMNAPTIPYNRDGYAMIEAAAQDVILEAVNFGAIRAGVTLSEMQKGIVNSAAGVDIDKTLVKQGWYFQVVDPSPVVRAARGSPITTLWYSDGQSIHRLEIASIQIA
jgi:hypothetical protein